MQVVHSSNGGICAFRSRAISYEFRDQEAGIGVASSSILGLAKLLRLAQQFGDRWYSISPVADLDKVTISRQMRLT
jgi:hypothetical protein